MEAERQRIQALSFFQKDAKASLSFAHHPLAFLASWRHLWLNRLRGDMRRRDSACVDRVGVLVCEFRGIVSAEHFPARIGTRGIGSLGARMDRDPLCSRLSRALSARVVSLRRLCGSSVCGRRVTEPPDLFFEPWRASVRERCIRDPSSMCRFKLCATIDRVYWSYLETSWFFRRIKMLKFFNRQIDILAIVLFKMADLSNISSFVINIFPYFVAKVINIFRQFLYWATGFRISQG